MTDSRATIEKDRFEEAMAWHACLEGEPQEGDWQAFTAWLEADPENRQAFDAVDGLSMNISQAMLSAPEGRTADVIAFRTHRDMVHDAAASRGPARFWPALAALAAAAVLVLVIQPWRVETPDVRALSTQLGERQAVTLADGSTVHLNTATALSVSLGRDSRDILFEKGEALFDVKSDPERPFVVAVADRRVRVVGTAFDVLRHNGRVIVSVERGTVHISRSDNAAAKAVTLAAGDRFIANENSSEYRVVRIDPALMSAWRSQRVIFEDATLSQVVSELNRYFVKPLVINDPAIASLHFSGVLAIDEEADVLRRLAAFLPITVQAEDDRVVLRRGASK